jgi:thiol:disulfide interchange protein DsbG
MRQLFRGLSVALTLLALGTGWSANAAAANAREQLAESMLTDIGQVTAITEGKGPHVIYIFFDPNCPYCHKLYENTRTWIKEGKVELRWVPVGILTTTSPGKAAALLGAKDPLKAFYYNEDHYSNGGAIEEDLATPEVEKQLKANAALLARTGFDGVPAMLFRVNDDTPILIQGSPPLDKLEVVLRSLK